MNPSIDDLTALVSPDEEIVAVGMAVRVPIVVTARRLIRAGYDRAVSIPFEWILGCEWWHDAHRFGVRLSHEPVDPRRMPCDAHQWWRWHDRRAYRRTTARMRRETELVFSSEQTAAAEALKAQLVDRGISCREAPSPVPRQPRVRSFLWEKT